MYCKAYANAAASKNTVAMASALNGYKTATTMVNALKLPSACKIP